MNYYQITFNNLEGFNPNLVHQLITANLGVTDWWHYIPSTYLIETTTTSYYLANRIISAFSWAFILMQTKPVNGFKNLFLRTLNESFSVFFNFFRHIPSPFLKKGRKGLFYSALALF